MSKALVWIRRDLRLHDHHALSQALAENDEVYLVFVFDKLILEKLPKKDKRLTFIHQSLVDIEEKLVENNSSLHICHGDPTEEIPKLIKKLKVKKLYYNRDYEPYAVKRDQKVEKNLSQEGVEVFSFKDAVYFEGHEIKNKQGKIYKVFTPFKRAWYEVFMEQGGEVPQYKISLKSLAPVENKTSILNKDWHKALGFTPDEPPLKGGFVEAKKRLEKFKNDISVYQEARDYPAMDKTSNISPYIRHGNVSVRDLLKRGMSGKDVGHLTWTSEVIWREFYQGILANFPHVEKKCFKPEYDAIKWRGGKKEWDAWKNGQTGFPLVDAAMRCLNETGLMHNRLRMVVASFLCKTLLIDWRKGERYFAEKLLDFDLAANNGGWQWSASTGTDAQPYFRIFNPYSQSEKFDKEGVFIRKWCPELSNLSNKAIHNPTTMDMLDQADAQCTLGVDYPFPVVDYKMKRQEALEMYKEALGK
ncbi:MAG: DNA photolyase family protein [Halobacteriovoraceae bacterium]|nr:DNA photolyase family protein [Halobacteriovoraceae bacterium]